jgi:hypothetical protein
MLQKFEIAKGKMSEKITIIECNQHLVSSLCSSMRAAFAGSYLRKILNALMIGHWGIRRHIYIEPYNDRFQHVYLSKLSSA